LPAIPRQTEQPDSNGDEPPTVSISKVSSSTGIITDDFPVDLAERFVRHEQLGRGGFGSVFRAYDRQLNRFVAIKVPHINAPDRDRVQKRVAREATATARLRHPNIVTLFDFIHVDDHSLLVNELIQGETLTRLIGRNPNGCDFRLAAAIVQRIASAVQHAHDQSVLHRDIKPSNIMLDATHADGDLPFCPRLTDFGLATILRDSDSDDQSEVHTETIGTWHYTPPEVIRNKFVGHTPTCDIYSLGVVLYELITGTRPFHAATLAELLPKVSNGDFLPPRVTRSDVPRDLEAICLRCMARNPATRYPTAATLADDLSRFLAGDLVLARMPDRSERFFRWMRRNPAPAAISAISVLAIFVVFAVIATANRQLFKLNSQLESMNAQLQTALSTTRTTLYEYEQSNYGTDLANASHAIRQSNLRDARTLLSRYDDAQPLAHHRDIEWDHNRFLISKTPNTLWQSDHPLYHLCEVGNYYCTAGAASEIVVIERDSGTAVRSIPTRQKEINSLVFDTQHNLIWSSGDDG
jgi:serine/threonine protein kinase